MAEEKEMNEMPALEAMTDEEIAKGEEKNFEDWHDGHMERVKKGLETIIASEDLNEIKTIAQQLLDEEMQEGELEKSSEDKQDAEEDKAEVSMSEYLGGK